MSLWGSYDLVPQSNTATATIVVTAANNTVIGTNTKFADDFNSGNYLYVGDNNYVITTISNNTVMTVRSATTLATTVIPGASSNGSYIVSEKPMSITYAQANNAQVSMSANAVYGVSAAEMGSTSGESHAVAHSGWNLRTVGTGGRAGRVTYETLVAGGISGDADDDSILPDS